MTAVAAFFAATYALAGTRVRIPTAWVLPPARCKATPRPMGREHAHIRAMVMEMARQRPVVNTIPSHDVVLRRLVDRATETAAPKSADELTERLRPFYPRVAVFERLVSGEHGLYVYRDGRYEPESLRSWWEAPYIPCVRVSVHTGELLRVTASWAELMHAEARDLVGRHYLEFLQPEGRAIAGAVFDALQSEREVRSEAVVQRADGSTFLIEFRAVRRHGEIEVCYRPLEG